MIETALFGFKMVTTRGRRSAPSGQNPASKEAPDASLSRTSGTNYHYPRHSLHDFLLRSLVNLSVKY